MRGWWVLFFTTTAVASLSAGTVHGFFADEATAGYAVLWPFSLLAIGVAALAAWAIGARLGLRPALARWVVRAAFVQLAVYGAVVLGVTADFRVAIADYLPAVVFLLVVFVALAVRRRGSAAPSPPGSSAPALAAGGLALTLVAAALQQLEIGIDPVHFNHNALFHVLQAVALALVYLGLATGWIAARQPDHAIAIWGETAPGAGGALRAGGSDRAHGKLTAEHRRPGARAAQAGATPSALRAAPAGTSPERPAGPRSGRGARSRGAPRGASSYS